MNTLGIITLLFLCLGSFTSNIENPCNIMEPRGGDEDWGEGAYYIPEEFQVKVYDNTFQPRQVFFIPSTIYFPAFTILHLFHANPKLSAAAVSPTCGPRIAQ